MTDTEMTAFPGLKNFSELQDRLDRLGLTITLKEPTEAMLKRGWHCIDFDRPGYAQGRTQWDRPPPHQTSMKQDVRAAFTAMNEEAQAEISRWTPVVHAEPDGADLECPVQAADMKLCPPIRLLLYDAGHMDAVSVQVFTDPKIIGSDIRLHLLAIRCCDRWPR